MTTLQRAPRLGKHCHFLVLDTEGAGLCLLHATLAHIRSPGLAVPVNRDGPAPAPLQPECPPHPKPRAQGPSLCVQQSCYPSSQAVEKLVQGAESGCHSEKEKQVVLNCSRLLTRVLPYIFEDPDWRGFFWSTVPGAGRGGVCGRGQGGWEVMGLTLF